jgi:hypothetical protein
VGEGTAATLDHELERLYATGSDVGYLAYGVRGDGELSRIDGTRYFYRDGSELTEERETFEELMHR